MAYPTDFGHFEDSRGRQGDDKLEIMGDLTGIWVYFPSLSVIEPRQILRDGALASRTTHPELGKERVAVGMEE